MSSYEDLDLVVLKALTFDKEKALNFTHENTDAKLFSPEVWNFAHLVVSYIKAYKDVPTLQVLCEKNKDKAAIVEKIKDIWNRLESTEYLPQEHGFYIDKIKERFKERQLNNLKKKLENSSTENAVAELHSTLKSIKHSADIQTFENKSIREYLPTFVEKYKHRRENPNEERGVMTGYTSFDFATNGLREADFVLVAGPTGGGKSILLNALGTNIWKGKNKITDSKFSNGKDLIYFSLEMPYEDCFNRFLAGLAGVSSRDIENATLSKDDFGKVKQALEFIKNYPYEFRIVDLSDPNCNDLDAVLEESGKHYDVVVVDYLNIMRSNSGKEDSDHLMQGAISYELRMLVRKHKSIMITGNQLNTHTNGEKIGVHRLGRARQISTNCTHILQIEERENEVRHSDMAIHFIKNRRGPKLAFSLLKNLACCRLDDVPVEREDAYNTKFTDLEDISDDVEGLDF